MEVFWIWLIGFVLTTLGCGVLYSKEIIDWKPSGGQRNSRCSDDGPPHMVLGAFWFIALPIAAIVYFFIYLYKAFLYASDWLARFSFERKSK